MRRLTRKKNPVASQYFLSLGAGDQQLPLIAAAKRKGYMVVAIDKKLDAPGLLQADMQVQCSILQPRRISRLVYENIINGEVIGVGCRSHGDAQRSAMLVAKKFNVPGNRPNTLKIFRNKKRLKKLLHDNGVPVFSQPSLLDSNSLETIARLGNPVVARPIDGYGKQGVLLLKNSKEIISFYRRNHDQLDKFLIEDYIDGLELTVLAIIENGKCETICISDKEVLKKKPWFVEIKHSYPTRISNYLQEQIPKILQKICDITQLENGPFVAEFIVPHVMKKGLAPIYLVECQPEVGGEYLADQLLPHVKSMDFFDRWIEISSKKTLVPNDLATVADKSMPDFSEENGRRFIIRYIPQSQDGILKSLKYPHDLLNKGNPYYVFHRVLKHSKNQVRLASGNLGRIFVFGMCAPIQESAQLSQHVEDIVSQIIVEYE